MVNLFNLAKSSLVLPAAVSSFWLVDPVQNYFDPPSEVVVTTFAPRVTGNPDGYEPNDEPNLGFEDVGSTIEARGVSLEPHDRLTANRVRIERILSVLNRVAEASMQMDPERASQLEPVILDLAEQAMALSGAEIVIQASTLRDLDKIELTVQKLSHAVVSSVEPEMQL